MDAQQSYAEIIAECYHNSAATRYVRKLLDRLDAAHRREITILLDTLAEVIASIESRFPAIESLDRKPYLDAKKILEQYKEEAALATPRHLEAASLQDAPAN